MGTLKTVLLFCMFILLACSRTTAPNEKRGYGEQTFSKTEPLGVVERTDGAVIDLDSIDLKSIVLIFASDTCSKCAEEAKYWSNLFKNGVVKNIYFAHFLIGGNRSDATDWMNFYHVNWDVVLGDGDSLYKKYCPAVITPCFLVENKGDNKLVQTYNVLRKEDLEEITGPWEF